ncbi:MAG: fumarate hydratase C-terminal domain-containing protein [Gammaproteobacteria bacterium]|nr:fumarate hydratase C-terminal domain-containing protein [Gammaproteobacteria bacterium]
MADAIKESHIKLPATPQDIAALEIGSIVYLSGVVYTAREGVYERVMQHGETLPDNLSEVSNVNFHCSPAAARGDDGSYSIGGVTATASFRFSKYMPDWLDLTNTKIVIGKGGMPRDDYKNILAPRGAIYLTTVGYGTGALLGRGVKGVKDVFWLDELGIAQAMWLFEVENFGPFIVDSDLEGNSLFAQQGDLVNENIESLYDGLEKPALHRYGETDDRKDELM